MKRSGIGMIMIAALATLSLRCGTSGEANSNASFSTASKLTVTLPLCSDATPDTIHLGRIHEGEIIASAFTIDNSGEDAIAIIGINVDCGCTQTRYDNKPILAGESRRVDFSFDSEGREGKQCKAMSVQLSGGAEFKVCFLAEVLERN